MNNLVLKEDNYDAIAKTMGISLDNDNSSSNTLSLPRVRLQRNPITIDKKIDGKKIKEEVMEGGSYQLSVPEGDTFNAMKAHIRVYMQRFMYKKWFPNTGKFEKSVMSDSFNIDLKDTLGTFNIGRPLGYQKDFNSLPQNIRDAITSVKRVRVLFGKIMLHKPVVDSKHEEIAFQETPFIWEIDNPTGFKNLGVPLTTLSKMQLIPINYKISLGSEEQTLPNGSSYYLPVASLDLKNKVDIVEDDQTLFTQFQEWIQNYNSWVVSEWDKNVQNNDEDTTDEDKNLVDNFIDFDNSEEKTQ